MHNSRAVLAMLVSFVGLGLVGVPVPTSRAASTAHTHLVSEDPADSTPHVLDDEEFPPIAGEPKVKVTAILPMEDRIYVGGTFTGVRNQGESTKHLRPGLFALDPVTLRVDDTFDPVLDGAVEALAPAPDGDAIFVAGLFDTVDGQSLPKVAKLDAATGEPVASFRPHPSAPVKDVAVVAGDRLVLAGRFSTVAGQPRGGLAAVDVQTGALDPALDISFTEPRQGSTPRVETIAVTPDGATLVAGGNFTEVDGEEQWQVALLDVTPGRPATVLDWHTDRFDDTVVTRDSDDVPACASAFDAHPKDIAMSPDGTYFVVVTTGGYTSRGPLCDTASRWETADRGTELQPTWANYNGGDTLTGVAVTDAAVYVGGHMRWMNNFDNNGSSADAEPGDGSVEREGLAALDPGSGLPLPWNPRRERGHGPEAIVATPEGLWVGSDTNFIGQRDFDGEPRAGEYHSKLAFLPLAGGHPAGQAPPPRTLPADLHVATDDGLLRRAFDGSSLGGPEVLDVGIDWSEVRGAFTVGERLYTGTDDGELVRWIFDGTGLVQVGDVDLRGLDSSHLPIEDVSGMFYDQGRVYFTVAGDEKLHYRFFLSQPDVGDDIIGDDQPYLVAGGEDDGLDWSGTAGMVHAGGHVYYSEDGDLYRVAFAGGRPSGQPVLVAPGAGLDPRALFLGPPAPPPSTTTTTRRFTPSDDPPDPPEPARSGYWMLGAGGAVYPFGDAAHLGEAPIPAGFDAVDLEPTPSGNGYWILDGTGAVHARGDARHRGGPQPGSLAPGEEVTSLSATPSGEGYWLFTTRGRVLAFGDADHLGDMSGVVLNGPVLDSIPTPSGQGYYMVASDGGIFSFGDAAFYGSMGGIPLNAPVESLVPDGDGAGYWLVAGDGGVFAFEAPFRGSMGGVPLNRPVSGMVPYGDGYLMVATDGGIFNFSDRAFLGSLGDNPPDRPVVAVAALE